MCKHAPSQVIRPPPIRAIPRKQLGSAQPQEVTLPQGIRLSEEHAAFVQGGYPLVAAAADARLRSSLALALGCRVSADRRRVTVYLAASKSRDLLDDIEASRTIAMVCSEPSTHRTIQLKGVAPARRAVRRTDRDRLDAYLEAFVQELLKVGEDEAMTRAAMACEREDVVAIEFTPTAAFGQTPGAHAGDPITP